MNASIRHIGIIVKDLEESIKFYDEYFDLKLFSHGIENGEFIDDLVGLSNVYIIWAKLKDNNILLELLEYKSHITGQTINLPTIGAAHIAFTVKNVDDIYMKLNSKYKCTRPQKSPDGKVRVFYCNGPDGITLELVEEL